MAIPEGARTARQRERVAEEEKKRRAYEKADRKRYRQEEETRRKKIAAKFLELAGSNDDVRRVLELVIVQIRQEPGGRIFDHWTVPSRPDPNAIPATGDGCNKITSATSVEDTQAAESEGRPEVPDHDGAAAVQSTTPDVTREKNDRVRWEAKFATRPGEGVLDQIKQLGGKWNKEASMWVGNLPETEVSQMMRVIEGAGGKLTVVPSEPASRSE